MLNKGMLLTGSESSGLPVPMTMTVGEIWIPIGDNYRTAYGWATSIGEAANQGSVNKVPYWTKDGNRFTLSDIYWEKGRGEQKGVQVIIQSSGAEYFELDNFLMKSNLWDGREDEFDFYDGWVKYGGLSFVWDHANTYIPRSLYSTLESSKGIPNYFMEGQLVQVRFDPTPTGYL